MNFVSYRELVQDVLQWSQQLPSDLDAIIGIPRSGIIPASVLALHRNISLGDLKGFADGKVFGGGWRHVTENIKKVLVLDDSILSGQTLREARDSELCHLLHQYDIYFGGVYASPRHMFPAFLRFKLLDTPRIFEWNMFHGYYMRFACLDMDGVLCRDPTKQENDDGVKYRNFIDTAEPRYIPTVKVNTIVTARLEKYRKPTEAWLAKHKVSYGKLIMLDATAAERRKYNLHAPLKISVYSKEQYKIFIESSYRQAREISDHLGKPVICTDTMELFDA